MSFCVDRAMGSLQAGFRIGRSGRGVFVVKFFSCCKTLIDNRGGFEYLDAVKNKSGEVLQGRKACLSLQPL